MTGTRQASGGRQANRLDARSAVALVAGREIRTRIRSKAYLITTGIMLLAVVALVGVTTFLGGDTFAPKVGLTGSASGLSASLKSAGTAVGKNVVTSTVPDRATGERKVRDGDLDALVTGSSGGVQVVVDKNLGDELRGVLTVLAQQHELNAQIAKAGGDPAQVNRAVAAAGVHVQSLQPSIDHQGQRLALGMFAGFLIYLSLMIYGQTVAQGVIEEKANRIVELLLAAVKPWQLMAGKVLGIGVVGLIQMLVVSVVGAVLSVATGVLAIPSGMAVGTVVSLVVWYLIGFFMYALLFGAAGALVSRQEDAGGVTGPIMMLVMVPFIVGFSILPNDPGSRLIEVLSMIPLFSPLLMPMRAALGAPGWQVAVALVLSVALVAVLMGVAGRVYVNAVTRTGARVRLAEAFRPA